MRLFSGILSLFDALIRFMLGVELFRLLLCIGVIGIIAGLFLHIRKMTV